MVKVKGLYLHSGQMKNMIHFIKTNTKYEGEGDITIAQYKEYIMVQNKMNKAAKGDQLIIFKNGELCLRGSSYRILNKEQMEEELKWVVEQYEKDQED